MAPRYQIISLSGMDGCGKSTIIDKLMDELRHRGISSRTVWLRYNHYTTRALLAVCRIIGLTKYERVGGVRVGYHNFHRSRVVSHLFIVLTLLDTFLATLLTVYIPAMISGSVVICDRWVADILVDLEVDTRFRLDRSSLYRKMFLSMVPRRARCFLIERRSEELLGTRPENGIDRNFPTRLSLYRKLAAEGVLDVVENNTTVDAAVDRILRALRPGAAAENMER